MSALLTAHLANGAQQLAAAPSAIQQHSSRVWRVCAFNPGPKTLHGTNTYLIGTGARRLLLDTGEGGRVEYTEALDGAMRDARCTHIERILISHHHIDHTGGIADVRRMLRRRATADGDDGDERNDAAHASSPTPPAHKHPFVAELASPLPMSGEGGGSSDGDGGERADDVDADAFIASDVVDNAVYRVEGATLRALHTPGHTSDHVCFWLEEECALFTADSILGTGTAVFENLHTYLASLDRLHSLVRDVERRQEQEQVQEQVQEQEQEQEQVQEQEQQPHQQQPQQQLQQQPQQQRSQQQQATPTSTPTPTPTPTPVGVTLYPGHGPVLNNVGSARIAAYIEHQNSRERRIVAALAAAADRQLSTLQLLAVVYGELAAHLRLAALGNLLLRLHKLRTDHRVEQHLAAATDYDTLQHANERNIAATTTATTAAAAAAAANNSARINNDHVVVLDSRESIAELHAEHARFIAALDHDNHAAADAADNGAPGSSATSAALHRRYLHSITVGGVHSLWRLCE